MDACYPHAAISFSPDTAGFRSDEFYEARAAAGLQTHVVVQGRPLCQVGGAHVNSTQQTWKCVNENAIIGTPETAEPSSYSMLAAYLYQYAARYGQAKVPDAQLTLAEVRSFETCTSMTTSIYIYIYKLMSVLLSCNDRARTACQGPVGSMLLR